MKKAYAVICGDIEDCVYANDVDEAIRKTLERHIKFREDCRSEGCKCAGMVASIIEADCDEGDVIWMHGEMFMKIGGLVKMRIK